MINDLKINISCKCIASWCSYCTFCASVLVVFLPDKKECVYGEGCIADRLEHEVPLGDRTQGLVLCKVQIERERRHQWIIRESSVRSVLEVTKVINSYYSRNYSSKRFRCEFIPNQFESFRYLCPKQSELSRINISFWSNQMNPTQVFNSNEFGSIRVIPTSDSHGLTYGLKIRFL